MTCAAVIAAALGFLYRATPPPAREEFLAFWGAVLLSAIACRALQWRSDARLQLNSGPARSWLLRADRWGPWRRLLWGPAPYSWTWLTVAGVSGQLVIGNLLWLLQRRLEELEAVILQLSLGLVLGCSSFVAVSAAMRSIRNHRWIAICDKGVVAEGKHIAWSQITAFERPSAPLGRLLLSTPSGTYPVDVPAALLQEVEQLLRQWGVRTA
jgi:hypothetical protein